MIEILMDKRDLAVLLDKLSDLPKGIEIATSRAINKTLTSTRAEMVRVIRANYAIKAGDVRSALRITRSTPAKMEGSVAGEGSPGVPLVKFARTKQVPSTKRTKGGGYTPRVGISILVKKSTGRVTIPGAFIARMSSGHVGAFIRVNRGKKQKFSSDYRNKALALKRKLGSATQAAGELGISVRTLRNWVLAGTSEGSRSRTLSDKRRIEELYGPTAIKLLGSEENIERIEEFAQESLDKNMRREAEFYLSKAGL